MVIRRNCIPKTKNTSDDETVEKNYVVKRNYKEYYKYGGRIPNYIDAEDAYGHEYSVLPQKFTPNNSTWEMVFYVYVYFTSYTTYLLGQFGNERSCQIYLTKDKFFGISLSSDGVNWDIASNVEATEIHCENYRGCYLKLSWDGSVYKLDVSKDNGQTYSNAISVSSSTPIVSGTSLILGYSQNVENAREWSGSIYVDDCYIKINDKIWWKGSKSNTKDIPFTFPELTSEGSLGGDECGIQPLSDTITDLMNMFQPLVDGKPANGVYTTFQNSRDYFVIYSPEAFRISKMEYYYGREEDGTFEPKKYMNAFVYGSNNGEDWEELYYYQYSDNYGENDDVYSFNKLTLPCKYYKIAFSDNVKIGKIIISGYIEERLTKDDGYDFYEMRKKTYIPNRQIAYTVTFNAMPDDATIKVDGVLL